MKPPVTKAVLVAEMPKARGGEQYHPTGSSVEPVVTTLADLGITKQDSHRWQRVAGVPGEDFEGHVAAVSVWTSWPTP